MRRLFIPRTLWYETDQEPVHVGHEILHGHRRPMILLGEAGMGKSTLLEAVGKTPGYAICTARQLINRPDPASLFQNAHTLVIDALDEVSAQRQGDAVDLVLRQLGLIGYPPFILSCRIADWRSASARQGIADHYGDAPLELHIDPLTRDDAAAFLTRASGDNAEMADRALAQLEERGLEGLWHNPQTLALLGTLIDSGGLPQSKGELFERATALSWAEHREEKAETPLATRSESEVLDALGAAFAALILTGSDALSRAVRVAADDIAVIEVAKLPGADGLPDILGTRLLDGRGPERFAYGHRAIGEFLGARWLARQADTARKQRRLLALFHEHGLVPASLRGIHAWLAWHSSALAGAVIAADPMGVVEYGDADHLDLVQARTMLNALQLLSEENPRFFQFGKHRLGGILQRALLPDIADILTAPRSEFALQILILRALEGSTLVVDLEDILRGILLDRDAYYAKRYEAGLRLAELGQRDDWPEIAHILLEQDQQQSARLAFELAEEVGFDLFNDALIARFVLAQIRRGDRTVGIFHRLERDLPDASVEPLLEAVIAFAKTEGNRHQRRDNQTITDLAYALITRRMRRGSVEPAQLWTWLEPFSSNIGYQREVREELAGMLLADVDLRRAVQRHVLLDLPGEKTIWNRFWRLSERTPGLRMEPGDIGALLDLLDPEDRQDERWRELLAIASQRDEDGAAVREQAKRFAAHRADLLAWIDKQAEPRVPTWERREADRRRKQNARQAIQWQAHRKEFSAGIDKMRAGEYSFIISPAQAYLKLFNDMGDEAADGPGRISEWLGDRLCEAALEGFQRFLEAEPPHPDATTIAESHADSRHWNAAYIIVAALAERMKTDPMLRSLADERLIAGLYELRYTRIDHHAGIEGLLEALEALLRSRGAWEGAMRGYFEPQFIQRRTYVDNLHGFLHEEQDADLATRLAAEWLERFADLPAEPESALIDRLLASNAYDVLQDFAHRRLASDNLSDERRRHWVATLFLTDFEGFRADHGAPEKTINPELLWDLRERLGGGDELRGALSANQLEWLIDRFRRPWPYQYRPSGTSSGRKNGWDATDFLNRLISRLGEMTNVPAIDAFHRLRDAPADGYTDHLRIVGAEQRRKRVEENFRPPSLADVLSVTADAAPNTARQMQAMILEELGIVQAKLRGADVDWYKDFFDRGVPRSEEECSDTIIKMLRPLPFGIEATPEVHLADDKRCDIVCWKGDLVVPIEIKGQWHRDLWSSADRQLDHLYVNDWRAECGIYLVLWFGPDSPKQPARPGDGHPPPTTATELASRLKEASRAASDGQVEVVVLDFVRPSP